MRLPILTAVFLGTGLLAGCVGGFEDYDPPANTPDAGPNPTAKQGRAKFKSDVHGILARCGGVACHETTAVSAALGKFYTADGDASYTAIENAPTIVGTYTSIAPILTYITPNGGHNSMSYTDAEKAKISGWLALEAQERAESPTNPNPMPPPDPKAALREFSGCMTLENFNAAQMPQRWGALAADNNQKCANCHGAGGFSFFASNTADPYFLAISTQTSQMLKYFTVDAQAKVIINTGALTNAGTTLAGHPRFSEGTNPGYVLAMEALNTFYTTTMAVPKPCGPPKLLD